MHVKRNPRILISNDDGVNAPGLEVMTEIARTVSSDIWICAPEVELSGASHAISLNRPIKYRSIEDRRIAVDGTPSDCVRLAVNRLIEDGRPDLVLSGVNPGINLGDDVTYSGTVAVAMEAALHGIRALAFSQSVDQAGAPNWAVVRTWGPRILQTLLKADIPTNVLVNINFPNVPPDEVTGIHLVRHDNQIISDALTQRADPRHGRPYYWIGALKRGNKPAADTDMAIIESGGIAITPMSMDMTDYATMEALKKVFSTHGR
ncbi:MAG: 5'/3'-nucleotidase SurE [Pseudomonadota bacterium]|nr:5'/3'-nucleotidase SurE [Pseudomonadota bacterium]